VQFIVSARKTSRLVDELKAADWKRSPRTDADGQCEFRYQPEGWGKANRFIAVRYQKKPTPKEAGEPEQYQLFDTPEYSYRVFVTNMKEPVDLLVWFYNQRAGAGHQFVTHYPKILQYADHFGELCPSTVAASHRIS
jgi:hypothetical protein